MSKMINQVGLDEMRKLTYRFVIGAVIEWNWQTKQYKDMDSPEFIAYVNLIHTHVYRYLRGWQTLDGTCSDLTCTIALEARQVFGLYPA